MFRFTIRDVLWLMVVVGLAAGWGKDHRQLEDYARMKQQGHNDYSEHLIKDLLSESSRLAREMGQEVTIETRYFSVAGSPDATAR
jgi:hypothetical protein